MGAGNRKGILSPEITSLQMMDWEEGREWGRLRLCWPSLIISEEELYLLRKEREKEGRKYFSVPEEAEGTVSETDRVGMFSSPGRRGRLTIPRWSSLGC